jgi:hypothetical protein
MCKFSYDVYVASNFYYQCIIGLDILCDYSCIINPLILATQNLGFNAHEIIFSSIISNEAFLAKQECSFSLGSIGKDFAVKEFPIALLGSMIALLIGEMCQKSVMCKLLRFQEIKSI